MNVVILAGSNNPRSASTKLCLYIGRLLEQQQWNATLFDLRVRPLPFFAPDNRNPADVHLHELKQAMLQADAVVLGTPDYHGAMSGPMKNALDHLGSEHFDGKVVLSVSATGGAAGISPLQQMQAVVRTLHGINCPEWISIGGENRVFTDDGTPKETAVCERVERAVHYFTKMTRAFRGQL